MFLSKRYYENPNTKFNKLINTYDTEKLKTKLKKFFQVCSSEKKLWTLLYFHFLNLCLFIYTCTGTCNPKQVL